MICPLHGPVWRNNLTYILNKYHLWSMYEPEKKSVLLVYASMYGNTENAMNVIANKLAEKGVKDMHMYDVSKTHPSYIISDAWKYSHIIFASPTYNLGLYYGMENLMKELAALQFQNRKIALVGNGSWAPRASKVMEEIAGTMKNVEIIGNPLEITSSAKEEQQKAIDEFVNKIIESMK
jgi:flavorubredoxin